MNIPSAKNKFGFTLIEIMVVIAIIAALASMSAPAVLGKLKERDILKGTNNAKQIYYSLQTFENDYGSFPDDNTASQDPDLADFTGDNANVYLSQLIASGCVDSEKIFYLKRGSSTNKQPDNNISDGNILTAGENGFSYIMQEKGIAFSLSNKGSIPILVGAMNYKDASKQTFDPDVFNGKAIVLRIDGSVSRDDIKKNNQVFVDGHYLFDAAEDGIWQGYAPYVYLPQ